MFMAKKAVFFGKKKNQKRQKIKNFPIFNVFMKFLANFQ